MNNPQLERLYNFCILLKSKVIKEELEQNLKGYKLNNIDLKNGQFVCSFLDDNKNNIVLIVGQNSLHLTKHEGSTTKVMATQKDSVITEEILEKRSNGVILTTIKKDFARSPHFGNQTVLVDLTENEYMFTKSNIKKIMYKTSKDFSELTPMEILFSFKCMEINTKLENFCAFHNKFSSHMNHYIGRLTDNPCSNRTYLNGEEVSRIFDIVEGPDKIYKIYDLYNGIINERNLKDVKAIHLGLLAEDALGLKELKGIKDKEETLTGKSCINVSDYINYLKQLLYDKYQYKGEISLDREMLIRAITGKNSVESNVANIEQNDSIVGSNSKKLSKKIFKG